VLDHELNMSGQHLWETQHCTPTRRVMCQYPVTAKLACQEEFGDTNIERNEESPDLFAGHVYLTVRGKLPEARHLKGNRYQLICTHSSHLSPLSWILAHLPLLATCWQRSRSVSFFDLVSRALGRP